MVLTFRCLAGKNAEYIGYASAGDFSIRSGGVGECVLAPEAIDMVIRFGNDVATAVERALPANSMVQVSSAAVTGNSIGNAAFQHVRDNIGELNGKPGIKETDIIFLRGLMDSPVVRGLVKVQNRLEESEQGAEPVSLEGGKLLREVVHECKRSGTRDARELGQLLSAIYLRSLVETHDEIGGQRREHCQTTKAEVAPAKSAGNMHADTMRVVGLRKNPNEPLGLTVQQDENGRLVVARVLGGGTVDRQGLVHVGDIILEVNSLPVSSADDLRAEIARAHDAVTLKVAPGNNERTVNSDDNDKLPGARLTCYMRALFDYDPTEDTLLPCREIGLAFRSGDVLQIVDQRDPNWWQAKVVGGDGPAGLVPSLELEERRKAFVAPDADYVHKIGICGARISKRKRRVRYRSVGSGEFDRAELPLYEEVTRMPPFKRKTLVLVGPAGVGRRTLKNRLVNSDPSKFGTVVPYTTRPRRPLEEDGRGYRFVTREQMDEDVRSNRYLEYGEHNGHLYGTHLDAVREVIASGRMCVLDCSPAALKMLHNSAEFLPYVVFVAAPGMEQLRSVYAAAAGTGQPASTLQFDRNSSIRYSSRRARTLESLASLYEEDDLRRTVEESACLQRACDKYVDLVVVNNDFDVTFRTVVEALDALAHEHQWVPVNWIY